MVTISGENKEASANLPFVAILMPKDANKTESQITR